MKTTQQSITYMRVWFWFNSSMIRGPIYMPSVSLTPEARIRYLVNDRCLHSLNQELILPSCLAHNARDLQEFQIFCGKKSFPRTFVNHGISLKFQCSYLIAQNPDMMLSLAVMSSHMGLYSIIPAILYLGVDWQLKWQRPHFLHLELTPVSLVH